MTRTLLATAWVVLLSLTITLQAQSLAKAAKKAEEESAKAKAKQADSKPADKPPAKVYTNKDLAEGPSSTATTSTETTTPAKPATAPGSPKTPQDEDSWRARGRALRRTLADDQTKLAAAQSHYDTLPETTKNAVSGPVVQARIRAKEEISRLTAVVQNDKRAISDLEDEARRAGVPPGWLRER